MELLEDQIKEIKQSLTQILARSYSFSTHDDANISLAAAQINNDAYKILKVLNGEKPGNWD